MHDMSPEELRATIASLTEQMQALQARKPQLEKDARDARDAVVRAQMELERLTKECTAKLLELQGKRTVHETCRGHADYDQEYASDRWDVLLEQHGDNHQAMADQCETQSKRCNTAMARHLGPAQTLLGTFLTEHREAVSDEVMSDWRKSRAWMEQQVTRLEKTELPEYKDQAQEAYLASQNTFRQDVALALHASVLPHLEWGAVAPFALTAVVGSALGAAAGSRINTRLLSLGFAGLLVLTAGYTALQSVPQLLA